MLAQPDRSARSVIKACSIEIVAQATLLFLVVVPTATLVFPSLLIALGAFGAAQLLDRVGLLHGAQGWTEANFTLLLITAFASIVLLSAAHVRHLVLAAPEPRSNERRSRPVSGRAGDDLVALVSEMWRSLPHTRGDPPSLVWFPNFNVMASARGTGTAGEIQVSSALWQRATKGDAVAMGILAHEMCHLLFRDDRILRLVGAVGRTSRLVIQSTMIVILALAAALVGLIAFGRTGANSWTDAALHVLAVLCFSALFLLLPMIGLLLVGRQVSLITALMELRADAVGALWTSGLSGFAQALADDPSVRASSLADLRHSLLSADLTHLSTFERVALLKDESRLGAPKLRYFALSLLLPFLLPINPLTPLWSGGVIDHSLMALTAVTAHATTVAMLLVSSRAFSKPISWEMAASMALFLCLASLLPRVNLYDFGYLFTHLSAGLTQSGGFGSDPLTPVRVVQGIVTTLASVRAKLFTESGGWTLLVALGCAAVSLRALSIVARVSRLNWRWHWLAPSISAGLAALLSTYDEWRSFSFPPFDLAADWINLTKDVIWLRIAAPEVAAIGVAVLQIAAISLSGRYRS
ncbi:hypothetical protein [Bradyrhizobium sp. CCBAU 53380]|uniref:hypothetical protein n=1 Tax=Bradyrhizobium sp. CCBAU 53380 TaxID=1325117 RepID=UPI0023033AAC|nr:hypothetical protein [Bradyrhizobium sp. CCBAU 53380]MDA9420937.1 hypothetical protein [Bradyrhizobium sp. CCBAU 53380]